MFKSRLQFSLYFTLYFLVLSFTLLNSTSSMANSPSLQNYVPNPGSEAWSSLQSPKVLPPLRWTLSLHGDYAAKPLLLFVEGDNEVQKTLIRRRITSYIALQLGLIKGLDLSVMGGYVPHQRQIHRFDGDSFIKDPATTSGLIDPILSLRYTLLNEAISGIGISAGLTSFFPAGSGKDYFGGNAIRLRPEIAISKSLGGFTSAVNLAYRSYVGADDAIHQGSKVDDDIQWKAGASFEVAEPIDLSLEFFGSLRAKSPGSSLRRSPTELILSSRFVIDRFFARLGGGLGLVSGVGTPAYRGMFSLGYSSHSIKVQDSDGDGIIDERDKCIDKKEDIDSFEDSDGCPDIDNDGDAILDVNDKCPMEAENKNGFEDDDGCPEADDDGDGLVNGQDECPTEAEDIDGFEDDDGCPDKDNDKDTISDRIDSCPNIPEDIDGFEDGDGCPDKDNDKDGLLDAEDMCPDEAEVINNVDDEDGCPDEGEELIELHEKEIKLKKKIYFGSESDVIRRRSFGLLSQVRNLLRNHKEILQVRIEGHTDNTGSEAFNQKLSKRRAKSVMRFLIKRGLSEERLQFEGFGSAQPRANNDTPKGRGANRRVEFIIIQADEEKK